MRLRILGSTEAVSADKRPIERMFRLALGSWSGRLRRADVWVDRCEDNAVGLAFACRIRACLVNWSDIAVEGRGVDSASAVQKAARHLVRHLQNQSMDVSAAGKPTA